MKAERNPQQAALVIKWPQSVPAPPAREFARRLIAAHVRATWSLDQASQVEALASWGATRDGSEAALLVTAAWAHAADPAQDGATRELARRLELLRAMDLPVDVVHAGPGLVAGAWPRALRALGVHGVIVEGASEPGLARALPFGVWQFVPQASAPRARGWFSWLCPRRPLFATTQSGPVVVAVDMGRAAAFGPAGWREAEHAIEQAAETRERGVTALVTVGELAGRFAQTNVARPQRSILRAAA
jgi:hypothetical protein